MRYIVTMFWSLIIGQMISYIGGAVASQTYDFKASFITSVILGIIVILIGEIAIPDKKKKATK